ncbi:splicing factor PWI domain-containing protein [Iris pallida]|uniref:Splicing factor PWI domain-containing protein n=1 Tax=Iris pallida TaxID=29817 RepID=A0AAX6HEY7_IRIPA|nr:splicing factor PWI domain-containing protein [Iris pallida]KAJ6839248.1 splicing factor PWI domain-containing protein [Iris pallida]
MVAGTLATRPMAGVNTWLTEGLVWVYICFPGVIGNWHRYIYTVREGREWVGQENDREDRVVVGMAYLILFKIT